MTSYRDDALGSAGNNYDLHWEMFIKSFKGLASYSFLVKNILSVLQSNLASLNENIIFPLFSAFIQSDSELRYLVDGVSSSFNEVSYV